MTNLYDMIESNEISANAHGGTELMIRKIYDGFIPRDILNHFQIIPSRVRDLKEDKYRIYIVNDLVNDSECHRALSNGAWKNFHRVVFVSHMQAQEFIRAYNIPWSKVVVLYNAVWPIETKEKPSDKINLIYHTTPHRGLNILISVFERLVEKYPQINLDIYSSFAAYGWEERDKEFEPLFEKCKATKNVNFHGFKSNDIVREALKDAHIFAYPSIWQETSCLALMEAMSAECLCIHPDFGALPETAANWTMMYHWNEDVNIHAGIFYSVLENGINSFINKDPNVRAHLQMQARYANAFYNWENRRIQWKNFLESVLSSNEPRSFPRDEFVYNTK